MSLKTLGTGTELLNDGCKGDLGKLVGGWCIVLELYTVARW